LILFCVWPDEFFLCKLSMMSCFALKRVLVVALLVMVGVCTAQGVKAGEVLKGNIVDVIVNKPSSFFYLDKDNLPGCERRLPIGVFDSGAGGLTVLDAIVNLDKYDNDTHRYKEGGDGEKDFCGEFFVYLGDKANMPYGNYAKEGKTELLREHIIKDAQFLLGDKYYLSGRDEQYVTGKPSVKTIVIACNTATAFGKDYVEEFIDKLGVEIKVIGVIDAGVKAALGYLEKEEDGSMAVMATAGTVSSEGYVRAVKEQMAAGDYKGKIEIFQQAGIGLAGAIDGSSEYIDADASRPREGYKGPSEANVQAKVDTSIWDRYGFETKDNALLLRRDGDEIKQVQLNSVDNYISYHLVTLLEKVRKGRGGKLKVIILGCTHYPFYSGEFEAKLEELFSYREDGVYVYRPFMAEDIELVDPAGQTAEELYCYLIDNNLFNNSNMYKSQFYLSVPNELNGNNKLGLTGEFTYEYKYGRDAGLIQEYVKRVPFHRSGIMEEVRGRVSEKMPLVYEMIRAFGGSNLN
jgi:glutamate racemase